jgi:hypothetical protein
LKDTSLEASLDNGFAIYQPNLYSGQPSRQKSIRMDKEVFHPRPNQSEKSSHISKQPMQTMLLNLA